MNNPAAAGDTASATVISEFSRRNIWLPPIVLSILLILISTQSFVLFHTLAEAFAIVIAVLMYVVAWQTHRFSRDNFLMYLACGYFWIGGLDAIHALVYKGVGILPIIAANPATQFWITARYGEALLLLSAPLFLSRTVNRHVAFAVFAVMAAVLSLLIWSGRFPDAFIEGQGLTTFKIYSEYMIIALLTGALLHLYCRRALIQRNALHLMCGAIILTMGAELAFTFYVSVYGLSNLAGHIFKLFSFWLLFAAIVRNSLIAPYQKLQAEIDEHEITEMALRRSEHRHQQAIEQANVAFWRWSFAQDKLTYWSDNYLRLGGFEDVPDTYDKMLAAVHPDDRALVLKTYTDADKGVASFDVEYRVIDSTGTTRHLHEHADVEYDTNGRAIAHVGIIRDISDIKRADTALRQSEARLSSILQTAPEAVIVTDKNQIIQHFNQSAEAMFGYKADELLGRTLDKLLPANVRSSHDQHMERFAAGEKATRTMGESMDLYGLKRDGSTIPISASVSKLEIDGETIFIAMLQDITLRKKARQAIIESREASEMANRAKSEFLANMSHELRTPLNSIIGFSEILKENLFGKLGHTKYDEYAEAINTSGSHLLGIIGDILDISKIEAGEVQVDESDVDANSVIAACVDMVATRAHDATIMLYPKLDDTVPVLRADERHVRQIILNLLSNAIKFTPPGGAVTVRSSLNTDGGLEISVSDTGIGIPGRYLEHVMEPFAQVAGSQQRDHEGTGLGLPICKSLMGLHGGTLVIESIEGTGTTVTVTFPSKRISTAAA